MQFIFLNIFHFFIVYVVFTEFKKNALYKQNKKYSNDCQHKDEHISISLINEDDVPAIKIDHHTVTNLQVNKIKLEK